MLIWVYFTFDRNKFFIEKFGHQKKLPLLLTMTVPMKFYKHVLGVNKKSSNLAVLTELGQMPVVCDCLMPCKITKIL